MTERSNDIKRYLRGEMTPAERHAFEKKALSDPFLADALEGLEQLDQKDLSNDLELLHKQLDQKTSDTNNKGNRWTWGLRIAAGLLLIFIATFTIWNLLDNTQKPSQLSSEGSTKSTQAPQSTTPLNIDSTLLEKPKEQLALADQTEATQGTTSSSKTRDLATPLSKITINEEVEEVTEADLPTISKPAPISEANNSASVEKKELPVSPLIKAEKEEAVSDVFKTEELAKRSVQKSDARSAVSFSESKNSKTISGRIVSAEDGSALPGVNILIKGTSTGTISDVNGNYTIQNTDASTTLVYSFIGLQSKEVPVANNTMLDVTMNLDVSQLSEVVVTGYGYTEKSESTPTVDLAHPIMGNRAYKKYLEENLRYPELALKNKIEGRVTIEFFVEIDGRLTELNIIRGIGAGCDEELIRLIKEGPGWTPTQKDGMPVRDKARVRLKFELPKD